LLAIRKRDAIVVTSVLCGLVFVLVLGLNFLKECHHWSPYLFYRWAKQAWNECVFCEMGVDFQKSTSNNSVLYSPAI
jgi:hypothetical protein